MQTETENKGLMAIAKSNNLPLLGLSALVGIAAGLVTSLYRLVLTYLETYSVAIYQLLSENITFLPLAFIVLAVMGYGIGALIQRFKMVSGSGIPQVKGALLGYFKIDWLSTLVAKFAGGALAMFAGLSLGREGPSIQLGASVAQGIGDTFAKTDRERRILIANGASAGLAAAFNAPLSGVIFTLEEVFKYFSPLILLTSMVAVIIADFVSQLIFGSGSIFNFVVTDSIPLGKYWILLVMGGALGLLGTLYNKTLLVSVRMFNQIPSQRLRPIIAFLAAGAIALSFPIVIGSGHMMLDEINISSGLGFLCLALFLKFIFSMISYGSGAPGGIFFPLLVIGAVVGGIFAKISILYFGLDQSLFANLVILSMAGTFTGIVRAPITGIVLMVEMTGSFSHLMPLSVVSLIAFVVADLMRSEPIYDSLLHNLLKGSKHDSDEVATTASCQLSDASEHSSVDGRVLIENIVHLYSPADQQYLRDLDFPDDCVLVSVRRHCRNIAFDHGTRVMAGDYLVFSVGLDSEIEARGKLRGLTEYG